MKPVPAQDGVSITFEAPRALLNQVDALARLDMRSRSSFLRRAIADAVLKGACGVMITVSGEPLRLSGLLRAPATLDQMKIARSSELGRSPFWEGSSRALPDPECCPGE